MNLSFVNNAYAEEISTTAPTEAIQNIEKVSDLQSGIANFLPLILIFFVFYFLVIRPQSKKMKTQQAMQNALTRGMKVLLNSGIYGQINKVNEDGTIEVEIAPNVVVKALKNSITENLSQKPEGEKK